MLSPQEKKLFFLLLSKERMKEIGQIMKLDPRTVDTYATSIYRKLEVENRFDLIIKYYTKEKSLAEAMTLRGI
jgi:DNA-binding CsgD family transcriptional regulator